MLIVLGVSGSGKGTMLKKLFEQDTIFHKVHSYTSRAMREGEVDGGHYCFVSKEVFEEAIKNDEFLEYAWVHQKNYYGTKKKDVQEGLDKKLIPLKELDIQWLEKLKSEKNPPFHYFSIFLDVSDEIMIQRITWRQKIEQDELERRLASAHNEREMAGRLCDVVLDASGTEEEVFDQISTIIEQEIKQKII